MKEAVPSEERLEKLEDELATVKRCNRLFLGVIMVSAIVMFAWACTHSMDAVQAQDQDARALQANRFVKANGFILKDERGNDRAMLGMRKDGPLLGMTDRWGRTRLSLGMAEGNPAISLLDELGVHRATMMVEEGGPTLTLRDEKENLRITIAATKTGPGIKIEDEKGNLIWIGIGKEEPSIAIIDERDKYLWGAP